MVGSHLSSGVGLGLIPFIGCPVGSHPRTCLFGWISSLTGGIAGSHPLYEIACAENRQPVLFHNHPGANWLSGWFSSLHQGSGCVYMCR